MALYLGDSNKKINIGTTLWNAKVKIPHFDVLDNELPISWSQSVVSNNYANFTVNGITYRHISNLVLSAEDMALLNLDVTFTALETGATVTESLTIDSSNVSVNEFGYVCVFGNAIGLLSATTSIDYGDFAIEKAGLYYAWISDVTTIADDFTFNLYMRPVVKIYSGDGYNLMNGSTIVLPEWDKTTYPYALITRTTLTGYGTYYSFFASSTPRYKHYKDVVNSLTIIESQNYASCTTEFGEKEWLEFKFGTSTSIGDTYQSFSSIIWSNYDIYQLVESETGTELINGAIVSVSDTIAYPKSDITDLDNTMIVEWDEAVTDLTSYDLATDSSGAFYKVADTILSSTNFSGGYYITGDNEAVQITDEMIVSSDGVVGVDGAVLCVTTAGAVYGDKTFPEAGLYMATKDVIKMFVYNIYTPINHSGIIPEGGTYYIGVTSTKVGDYTGATTTLSVGDTFPETVSDGDVYVYGDYEYRYNMEMGDGFPYLTWYANSEQNGWCVRVLDETKSIYTPILHSICNKNITNMSYTFCYCKAITELSWLIIPNSVTVMSNTFHWCWGLTSLNGFIIPYGVTDLAYAFVGCSSLSDISGLIIPNSVTSLYYTFGNCSLLGDVTGLVIPESVVRMSHTFSKCKAMTGTIQINSESLNDYKNTFNGTEQPITLVGTGTTANATVLELMASTANNGNVTIA